MHEDLMDSVAEVKSAVDDLTKKVNKISQMTKNQQASYMNKTGAQPFAKSK